MKRPAAIAVTVALVGLAAGGVYHATTATRAPTPEPVSAPDPPAATLPVLALDEPTVAALTKIAITQPDWVDEGSRYHTVTLERQAAGWEITAPIRTRASTAKVAALLDNLRGLTLRAALGRDADDPEEVGVAEARAVHVVAWRGSDTVRDLFFGRSEARGQLVRVAGVDGVFAMGRAGPGAYSGFLYTRGLRGWRETAILAFEPGDVAEVEVRNPSGRFLFTRVDAGWSASFARRNRDGTLRAPDPRWDAFDATRVEELLRAFRALAADDFGDEGQLANSGVDDAERAGGVLRIRTRQGEDRVLRVGKRSTNSGRWAIAESRWAVLDGGDGTLYALAPWTASWATANRVAFEARAP